MQKMMRYDNKRKKANIYSKLVVLLIGLWISAAGAAMWISGSFNLNCFYDVGTVYECFQEENVASGDNIVYDYTEGCLEVTGDEAVKQYYLAGMEREWRYISLELSNMNQEQFEATIYCLDKNASLINEKNVKLKSGKNTLKIECEAYSYFGMKFSGQKGLRFNIDSLEFRENKPIWSWQKALLSGGVIFAVYLVLVAALRKLVGRRFVQIDWYLPIQGLQKCYRKAGNCIGRGIEEWSPKRKSRGRVASFFLMLTFMQCVNVLGYYGRQAYFRWEMLICCVLILCVGILCKEGELRLLNWRNRLVFTWCVLWLLATVSDFIVPKRYAYVGWMMFLAVGFFFFMWGNMERREIVIKDFIYAIEWNFFMNALFCYLFRPYTPGIRYIGASYSPGVWGLYLVFVWCAFLARLDGDILEYRSWKKILPHLLGLAACGDFLWKTQSVSSVLPAILVLLIFFGRRWKYRKKKGIIQGIWMVVVLALVVSGSNWSVFHIPRILDREICFEKDEGIEPITSNPLVIKSEAAEQGKNRIFEKLKKSNSLESLTTGRSLYWKSYLREMNLWGHEEQLFMWGQRRMPHNGYLGIMHRYGIFAGIPYLLMVLWNIMYALYYYKKDSKNRKGGFFLFAVMLVDFILLLGENVEQPFCWLCWFAMYLMMGVEFEQQRGKMEIKEVHYE